MIPRSAGATGVRRASYLEGTDIGLGDHRDTRHPSGRV